MNTSTEENRDLKRESNRLRLHSRTGAEAEQNPEDAVGTRLAHSGPR